MEGLAEDVDLKPLMGQQVEQLCFGMWNVGIRFSGSVRIVVESVVVISGAEGEPHRVDDYRAHATELCQLLGMNVIGATRTSSGGLTLQMSSGIQIAIENSTSQYESFQVHIGDRTIVA